jgi:hypothetical protein
MNDGIQKNIPLFWKLLRNFEDYFFTENELDQQNPHSVTILEAGNIMSVLHQPMKTIKH